MEIVFLKPALFEGVISNKNFANNRATFERLMSNENLPNDRAFVKTQLNGQDAWV